MKYKLNLGQTSCLLIAILIVIFLGYQGYIRMAPIWFPKKENLQVKEWIEYQNSKIKPAFNIQYPKKWKIRTNLHCEFMLDCIYIHSSWNNLYSSWNIPNHDPNKSYIQITINWHTPESWSRVTDEFLDSTEQAIIKDEDIPKYFDQKTVNGYKALFAKDGQTKNNSVYVFTEQYIYRFTLDFKTQDDPKKVKDIYYTIINSFQLIN